MPVSVENEAQQSVEEAVQEGATPEEPAQESQAATGTTVAAEAETQVDLHPVSSQRVQRTTTRLGYGNLGQPTEHWTSTSINAVHAPATNNMYLHQYPVLPTPQYFLCHYLYFHYIGQVGKDQLCHQTYGFRH